jgi:cell division protein FtsI/penicillin-binding protein 2
MKPGAYKMFVLFAGFLVFVALIVAKLVDIQIVNHDYYSKIATQQHGFVRRIPAKRGTIFDRNLRPLAVTLPAVSVCADPSMIEDAGPVAAALADVLGLDRRAVARKLSDKDSRFKLIERAADVEAGLELKRLDLPGIYFEPAGKRVSPMGEVARNVIGCMSVDDRPLEGIELTLDHELRGSPGLRRYLRDALGNSRPCVGAMVEMPVSGNSVVLSIDADLQAVAEAALDEAVGANKAKGGCVVIVDPRCGDVLALASSPRGRNYPVRAVFEPGSALKVCTFATGLEMGRVDTTSVFDTNGGKLKVPGGWIRDDHPHDILDLIEAFSVSSNVVSAGIARRIGAGDFYRYLKAFGFGSKTGIALEGESAGILREPEEWSKRSLETLAIGQEIGVTAVQMAMAYAAVANGGKLLRPRLIRAIIDENGNIEKRYPAKAVRTVIRQETALEMIRLLETVVQEGTGVPARIEGVRIAGKTGTGQKAECGKYIEGKFHSVFAGFTPADDAKYVCAVVVDEPTGWTYYGGTVCGPAFKSIVEFLLRRDKGLIPSHCRRLISLRESPFSQGSTAVPASGVDLPSRLEAGKEGLYPSLKGLSLREATKLLARSDIRWRAYGSGRVVHQDPAAYSPLDEARTCSLTLGAME